MIVKNVEKTDEKKATFQVEVDPAVFENAVNKAYLKNKSSINIPGFRQGKAPRSVVEGMYGPDVFYSDAIEELVPEAFEFGLENSELRIVGKPTIKGADVTDEKGLLVSFEVELYPAVTLGQYRGLKVEKDPVEITDDEVEEELQAVIKRNARMIDVDREAQMGDTAVIDFDGYLNGEPFDGGDAKDYSLELGSGSFVPGFEEQVVGMKIGEEKDIDITFPEHYVEGLAGKDVVFHVKLNSLTMAEYPELDDDFVQDVSEFNTVEEYKADIKANLIRKETEENENAWRSTVISKACQKMACDVPDSMLQAKQEELIRNYATNFGIDHSQMSTQELISMMGIDPQTLQASIVPAAEFQVRYDILLDAIIREENLSVTDEEAEEYLQKVAVSIGAKPDDIREYFGMDFIRNEKLKEMATDIIISTAIDEADPEDEFVPPVAEEKETEE